jgi:cyanophycinase
MNLRMCCFVWIACLGFVSTAIAGEEGTVILHGGGNVSSSVRDLFLELSGGKNARLLVIPTADPDTPEDESRLAPWRARQPAAVSLLHANSREVAESEDFAEPLKQATGVWISGGRQHTLAAMYLKTPVERELSALLKRGGVIAGTSAGAAIQSRVMIVRGEVREGFDLVPSCVVDQHFLARNRQDRLWNVLTQNPQRIGIGVDEDTAAVICGDKLTVLGDSTVSICIAPRGNQQRRVQQLKSGDQFDLKPLRTELTASK